MTVPIYLLLVFHHHQPVGQFDDVIEHTTNVSYLPLIELLERHPQVKVGLHYSGSLLDWLKQNHSEIVGRLRALVMRKQVEMLSGGYYEPILSALPDEDKQGQIEKLTNELNETLGATATGLWLAERVWEPHLALSIAQAGLRYVIVDDTHFEHVGFDKDKDLFGYFITEEQGYAVAVFPTLSYLRYAIPWKPVESLIEWLRNQADQPLPSAQPKAAVMGDDGAKLGNWPGSFEYCWGDAKYMDTLFEQLEINGNWLKTATPTEYMTQYLPLGRAYLPTASYMEMGTWSLPPDAAHHLTELKRGLEKQKRQDMLRFLHGGIWRNFMVKYDEVNHLHKRMLMVSQKVRAMRRGRKRDRALDLLWAAQGNDPYWHGSFGGIYLFNFRVANYANLIAAEDAADSEELITTLIRLDFDLDGQEEIIVTDIPLNTLWSPAYGGALLELDFRPAQYNLLNVMTRHREGYHADLVNAAANGSLITPLSPYRAEFDNWQAKIARAKEPGLENRLLYDWHRRASFLDHFISPSTTLDEFYHAQYAEQGDFVNQPYQVIEANSNGLVASLRLERNGHVWIGDVNRPISLQKSFNLRHNDPAIHATYVLTHYNDLPIDLRFGIETVVGFDGGQDRHYCSLHINSGAERLVLDAIREFESVTRYFADTNLRNLTLKTDLSKPAFLWQFPLETITCSDMGFERGYQGTVFLQLWNIHLLPGESWQVEIVQTIQQVATRP